MGQLIENGRLVLRLMQDSRVPSWLKLGIPLLVAIYVISPVDLIPDFLIGPGQLDDLGIVLFAMGLFIRFAPRTVVDEHKRALGYPVDGDVAASSSRDRAAGKKTRTEGTIDGEYRVIPPDQQ